MSSNRSNAVGIVFDQGLSVIEQFLNGLTPQRVRELMDSPGDTIIPWVPDLTLGEIYEAYSRNATIHGAENLMDRLVRTHRFANRHAGSVLRVIEQSVTAEVGENINQPLPADAVTVIEDRALQSLIDGARRQFAVFRDTERDLEVTERVHQAAAQTPEAKTIQGAASFVLAGTTSMAARRLADNPDNSMVLNRGMAVLYATLPDRLGQFSVGLGNAVVRGDSGQALTEVRRFSTSLLSRGATEFLMRRYTTSFFARVERNVYQTIATQPIERTAAEVIVLAAGVYVGASYFFGPETGARFGEMLYSEMVRAIALEFANHGAAIASAMGRNALSSVSAAASHADNLVRMVSGRNLGREESKDDTSRRNSPR